MERLSPGLGADSSHWDQNCFKNINFLLIWSFAASLLVLDQIRIISMQCICHQITTSMIIGMGRTKYRPFTHTTLKWVILGGDWNASILEQRHINIGKSRELRHFVKK